MYVEKTFQELKNKIKKIFEINNDIFCLYYESFNEKVRKISVTTEEDYEIMIISTMINNNQKLLYIYFNSYF